MKNKVKEKFKASFIHLSVSALIIALFYLFVLNVWYPAPYFQVSGLLEIILMLIFVDVVIGPLLTFIIFKPNKASLKFDLSVIAAIQIAALFYGALTVYEGHPVYVAYAVDRFTLVSVNEVNPKDAKYDEFKVSTFGKPIVVYAKSPENSEERQQLLFDAISGLGDIENHSEYYEPIDGFMERVFTKSIPTETLMAFKHSKQKMEDFLVKSDYQLNDLAFLPLMGRTKTMLWAISRKTGKPIDVLDIDPWELS